MEERSRGIGRIKKQKITYENGKKKKMNVYLTLKLQKFT
jgi:hypothetical protein